MIKDLRAGDPAVVGPYKLLGRLGAGGMGEVYLGKSPGGRLVAIKLIRPDLAEERGFRSRFASEISAARNVSGIYTAAVVDADADAELPWMATVYVPGPSLTDAVEDNGPLPVDSVLALAAGLAEALQAIHRAGLVHRDLKPSNVLLASDGPRVIDFGISLALERSMMTATGMVMGSPGFMSPEQARGQREVGAPTDVFSLGAVLAFAATGNGPFGTGPTPALLYRVVSEPPDLTGVPDRLSALIERCLAKDPAERPTPTEILTSLGDDVEVLTGEWLPPVIAESMSRYSPTTQTPLPPALREQDTSQPAAGVAAAAAARGGRGVGGRFLGGFCCAGFPRADDAGAVPSRLGRVRRDRLRTDHARAGRRGGAHSVAGRRGARRHADGAGPAGHVPRAGLWPAAHRGGRRRQHTAAAAAQAAVAGPPPVGLAHHGRRRGGDRRGGGGPARVAQAGQR